VRPLADRRLGMVSEYSLVAVVVVLQAVINWHFASQSFFLADDFVQFEDALGRDFSLGYLLDPSLGQFSPGSRLVALVMQRYATLDFDVALGFLLGVHSVGVALVHRILRLCVGAVWWTFALAFAYGISIIFMPSLQWFSAGIGRFCVATLSLASIHAYLCWRRTGRPAWLAWSVVAVGLGLFFYFKAFLIPVYVVLIRVLLLDKSSVRDSVKSAAREWRVWALYAVPVVLYMLVSLTRSGAQSWHGAPLGSVVTYLRVAWLDGFIPGLFGLRVTVDSGPFVHTWAVALCQILLLAAVAVSVWRRPAAW